MTARACSGMKAGRRRRSKFVSHGREPEVKESVMLKAAVVVAVMYVVLVIAQGAFAAHGRYFHTADFELSGQFGDSFGPLSAFMAAAAAFGAWGAVREQRSANEAFRQTDKILQYKQIHRDFEANFFRLLEQYNRAVEQIDVEEIYQYPALGSGAVDYTGKDAFYFFVQRVREETAGALEHKPDYSRQDADNQIGIAYRNVFREHQSDLGQYYRIVYNTVVFIEEHFNMFSIMHESMPEEVRVSNGSAYAYVRLLRANLSEYELVLLGLNGLYSDDGINNLADVIEQFAILNNVSQAAIDEWNLNRFDPKAFRHGEARKRRRNKEVEDDAL